MKIFYILIKENTNCYSAIQGCLLTQLVRQQTYHPPIHSLHDVVNLIRQNSVKLNLEDPDAALVSRIVDKSYYDTLQAALNENAAVYVQESDGPRHLYNPLDADKKLINIGL